VCRQATKGLRPFCRGPSLQPGQKVPKESGQKVTCPPAGFEATWPDHLSRLQTGLGQKASTEGQFSTSVSRCLLNRCYPRSLTFRLCRFILTINHPFLVWERVLRLPRLEVGRRRLFGAGNVLLLLMRLKIAKLNITAIYVISMPT
jgi:hypothetical protein